MLYPRYYVTYAVMDGETGANPFWHACLILSKQEAENEPINVENCIGFYSLPSTTTHPIIKGLKNMLGFKIDLQDGHGILKQEVMRDLDGNGLHGISFNVTPGQYKDLIDLYKKRMAEEKQAIEELDAKLVAADGVSRRRAEESLAAEHKRPPRLYPFDITMDINKHGFDSTRSHACKNYALGLLLETKIIDEATRDKIDGGYAKHAFPRFSGLLYPFRLVSTGEPEKVISKHSKKVFYNRIWEKNQLFWATPPQTKLTELTKSERAEAQERYEAIRKILTRIRQTEIVLRQKISELEGSANSKRRSRELKEQLDRVKSLYETFNVADKNQLPACLKKNLADAESALNTATMSLTPQRVNYPFLMRAYESLAVRNALVALLVLAIAAATLLTNPVGIAMMATAGAYAGYQFYNFFREEVKFAEMRKDYLDFQKSKQRTVENSEEQDEGVDTPEESPRNAMAVGA